MKVRPLNDWVLVKRGTPASTTSTGLVLPPSAQTDDNTGEVVSVGRGRKLANGKLVEPNVKAGDKVIFEKFSGVQVEVGGVNHMFMKEAAILAVLPK